jgi:DNA-binding transcriptional regulator YhcF (GntR family)
VWQGCGIRDRTTLSKALQSLEQKGIIQSEKSKDERGENVTTIYSLRFRKMPHGETATVFNVKDAEHQEPSFVDV